MILHVSRDKGDSGLEREVWCFDLNVSFSGNNYIYFNSYHTETRRTVRCTKWEVADHWDRLERRNNNITNPPLPSDVEEEARGLFKIFISTLPIVK